MERLAIDYTTGVVPRDQAAVILNTTGKIMGLANLAIRTGRTAAKDDPITAVFEARRKGGKRKA